MKQKFHFFPKQLSKSLLMILLVANFAFSAQPVRAGYWGENWMTTIFDNAFDQIMKQLEGAILASLKTAAVEMVNSKVGQMIGGSSLGEALFISDWNQFLYEKPASQVQVYMNDFFAVTLRGKSGSANYLGAGDVAGNVSGNYTAYLEGQARSSLAMNEEDLGVSLEYTLDSYSPNPELLFAEGDYRGLNAFFSNPANNPFGYTFATTAFYAKQMNREIERVKTEAQSSGFVGKKQNGQTIAPAATIENMLSDAQNIGNNIMAAAENPGQLVGSIIGNVLSKYITNMIQKGVGKVQASIQREVRRVDNQVVGALDKANKKLGPAAEFTKEWSQRTDTYIKPYTTPPPSSQDTVCGTGSGAC